MAEMSGVAPVRTDLSGGSQRLVLLALVLGVALGAGTVGLSWFLGSRAVDATSMPVSVASVDAAAACATLARVPALGSPDFTGGSGSPAGFLRLSGAASLASAAGAADAGYQSLSVALNEAARVIVVEADTRGAHAAAALAAARAACADH